MKLKAGLALLAVLALGACAHHMHGSFRVPDPTRPEVVLTPAGQLVVNQEPIVVPENDRVVTWRLPPGSGLVFDGDNGIRIIGRVVKSEKSVQIDASSNGEIKCHSTRMRVPGKDETVVDHQSFACEFPEKGRLPKGLYFYEINVSGPQGHFTLDPSVWPP